MLKTNLTRVEELVLKGASYGMTSEEIAEGLGISRRSVGLQVAQAYSKVHQLAGLQEEPHSFQAPSRSIVIR